MAGLSKVGRPVCEADLDWEHSPSQEIYNQFDEALRSLSYADVRKLARAFNITPTAVMDWKSGRRTPPGLDPPFLIIQWVEKGKPVIMRTQADIAASERRRNKQN